MPNPSQTVPGHTPAKAGKKLPGSSAPGHRDIGKSLVLMRSQKNDSPAKTCGFEIVQSKSCDFHGILARKIVVGEDTGTYGDTIAKFMHIIWLAFGLMEDNTISEIS